MERPILNPVGVVISSVADINEMPLGGKTAQIEIFPEYSDALLRIETNSHLWILSWFHKANREILQASPRRINPELPNYGVFSLRAFNRPNPIGLSLVELDRVEGNILHVRGLDAISGTPVLDIKPYFENDIIFSPRTPYMKGKNLEMRRNLLYRQAYRHHQEDCIDLHIAVRMALIAEEHFGKIHEPDLLITVLGSLCLGDCLQGVSRARLANPPRFSFKESDVLVSVWRKNAKELKLTLKEYIVDKDVIKEKKDTELFEIVFK
ncbi:MAG: tRNA (N6-threonylcarbamoyladenosine(37)-N6)-methyltransferase TrmO [Syntrophomonadaceae bacterium]|nr:tRNA (N6-threonylcarbamoyladenosine(37)-N6)-methyltransferase TrmO [Syntrophomonadaceae bacterium]